jgi:hypothetical protein
MLRGISRMAENHLITAMRYIYEMTQEADIRELPTIEISFPKGRDKHMFLAALKNNLPADMYHVYQGLGNNGLQVCGMDVRITKKQEAGHGE